MKRITAYQSIALQEALIDALRGFADPESTYSLIKELYRSRVLWSCPICDMEEGIEPPPYCDQCKLCKGLPVQELKAVEVRLSGGESSISRGRRFYSIDGFDWSKGEEELESRVSMDYAKHKIKAIDPPMLYAPHITGERDKIPF